MAFLLIVLIYKFLLLVRILIRYSQPRLHPKDYLVIYMIDAVTKATNVCVIQLITIKENIFVIDELNANCFLQKQTF